MTKPERGSLDWYRDLCQMHWSNDDLICILSGQGQVKMPGWMVRIFIHAVDQMDGYPADSCAISPMAFLLHNCTVSCLLVCLPSQLVC